MKTFEEWKNEVEVLVNAEMMGLGLDDLPDDNYYDYYESDVSPEDMAAQVCGMMDMME